MDLVIRSSYGRGGNWKQKGRDDDNGGEGTCSSYGSQRTSRSHLRYTASGNSTAMGDHEEDKANIGSGKRSMEGNGGRGVCEKNEESGVFELNEGESCSERDNPGLERPTSQDFEHQQEVICHLKRKLNYSFCECVSSYDMSHFQPFHVYFKLQTKALSIFNYSCRWILDSSNLDNSYLFSKTKISSLFAFITQITCLFYHILSSRKFLFR